MTRQQTTTKGETMTTVTAETIVSLLTSDELFSHLQKIEADKNAEHILAAIVANVSGSADHEYHAAAIMIDRAATASFRTLQNAGIKTYQINKVVAKSSDWITEQLATLEA